MGAYFFPSAADLPVCYIDWFARLLHWFPKGAEVKIFLCYVLKHVKNSFPIIDSFWSKSKGWEGWMCSSTLFKMKTSLSGKEGLAVICWKTFVSFASELWLHCEALSPPDGPAQVTAAAVALGTCCVRWHAECGSPFVHSWNLGLS